MLKRGFSRSYSGLEQIDSYRYWRGLFIGLVVAFSFYAFFSVSREAIRVVFSITFNPSSLWVIEKPAMDFYNLFFAFLSCIIGQGICFEIWYNHPGQFQNRRYHYKRHRIVHDQRSVTWYFLFWFAKMGVLYGFLFGMTKFQFVFSFYPDYNYVFILIIIVLYLNQWISVRRIFKGRSLKWMLVSVLVISSLSYGMSKFNAIDYEKLNHSWLSNTVEYNYQIEIPEASISNRLEKRSLIEELYYVYRKEDNAKLAPCLVYHNKEFQLDDLNWIVEDMRESRDEKEIPFITCKLFIDRDTKMKHVKKFLLALRQTGMLKIAYAVIPKPVLLDRRAYIDRSFSVKLPPYCHELHAKIDTLRNPNLELKSTEFTSWNCFYINTLEMAQSSIKISIGEVILINEKIVSKNKITQSIKAAIQDGNKKNIILLKVENDVSFGTYIDVKSKLWKAVYELRDQEALQVAGYKFEELRYKSRETYNEIKLKYPIRIAEPTEAYWEFKRYLTAQHK